jgi:beta-xylosidase
MTHHKIHWLTWITCGLLFASPGFATNPLIMDQFTADPTARVFEGKIYVYPSHDIKAPPEYKGRPNWFCMEDYHVFSSENLTDWTDHGVIVSQTKVEWANPTAYSMWAPDCVSKDGKYYFYFPATGKAGGFQIGVAIADKPTGPFTLEAKPIAGVRGIDPCVLIDRDGSAYLFYSMNRIFVAKLKANMVELDGAPAVIANLPTKGLLEGPFVFERKGIYYLTYPHVENKTERLEYAIGRSPMGPFTPAGVILDESTSGCWTVHQSIVEFKGQWLLFYHDKDLSPDFDKNRAIRADRLAFNDDGTIQKVTPTLRGVGIVNAKSQIQIDRYSAISETGVTVAFVDEKSRHEGWKVALGGKNAWVQFNEVDFGSGGQKSVNVRSSSSTGGSIELHLDKPDGPLVAKVAIEKSTEWKTVPAKADKVAPGLHNLVVTQAGEGNVELDWISFN